MENDTEIEVLSKKRIYEGKVFDLLMYDIRQGELEYQREIIQHHGSVVIVPVFEDGTVALVRQYRHAAGKFLLEIPAGTMNKGADPESEARRELEEEIGVTAEKMEKLTEFYVSPGFLTEKMFVYKATRLTDTAQNLDEDEVLSIERYSFEELDGMIMNGEIEDAKTIAGILLASREECRQCDS